MKFGRYLEANRNPAFMQGYIEFAYMKAKLKEIVDAKGGAAVIMPATGAGSRTHPNFATGKDVSTMLRDWALLLEEEFNKVETFTPAKVAEMQASFSVLSRRCATATLSDVPVLMAEAEGLSTMLVELEKFIRINSLGLEKIVKKHDKMLGMSTRLWLLARLETAAFTNVKLDGFLVTLSDIFSRLRELEHPEEAGGKGTWVPPESFERVTTKYWVRVEDVIRLKTIIMKHLPVLVFGRDTSRYHAVGPLDKERMMAATDSGTITSIYIDSDDLSCYAARIRREEGARLFRLRWYGPQAIPSDKTEVFVERKTHHEKWIDETSVKERFGIKASKVVTFMNGSYDILAALDRKVADGELSASTAEKLKLLAKETQDEIVARTLTAKVRTRYKRAAYQHATDNAVRISLDTELQMFNEWQYADWRPGQWCNDSKQMGKPNAVLNFPYEVLEIKLQDPSSPPAWVSELLCTGIGTPVYKSSKFLSGAAHFFPDKIGGVLPHWFREDGTLEVVSAYRTAARRALTLAGLAIPPELEVRSGEVEEEADESVMTTSTAALHYYRAMKKPAAPAAGAGAGAGAAFGAGPSPDQWDAARVRTHSGRVLVPAVELGRGPAAVELSGLGGAGAGAGAASGSKPAKDAFTVAVLPAGSLNAAGGVSAAGASRPLPASGSKQVSFAPSPVTGLKEPLLPSGGAADWPSATPAAAPAASGNWFARLFGGRGGARNGYAELPASGIGRPAAGATGATGGGAAAAGHKNAHVAPWSAYRDFALDLVGRWEPPARQRLQPVRVEPKTLFANERNFLKWLSTILLLIALTIGLVNFESTMAQTTAKILGPPCIVFLLYALFRYYFKAFLIRTAQPFGYHDRWAPLAVTAVLVAALIVNLIQTFQSGTESGRIRSPAPPTAALHSAAGPAAAPALPELVATTAAAAAATLWRVAASVELPRFSRAVGLGLAPGGFDQGQQQSGVAQLLATSNYQVARLSVPALLEAAAVADAAAAAAGGAASDAAVATASAQVGADGSTGSSSAVVPATGTGVALSIVDLVDVEALPAIEGFSRPLLLAASDHALHIVDAETHEVLASKMDNVMFHEIRAITVLPAGVAAAPGSCAVPAAPPMGGRDNKRPLLSVHVLVALGPHLLSRRDRVVTVVATFTAAGQFASHELILQPVSDISWHDVGLPSASGGAAALVTDIAVVAPAAAPPAASGAGATAYLLIPHEGVVRSFAYPCWEPLAVSALPAAPAGGWRAMAVLPADGSAAAQAAAATPTLLLTGADGRTVHVAVPL